MGQYFTMFRTVCLSLLISATVSLPSAKHADSKEDRGLILDILGGIVAGDSTTPSPSESTTMATLYGDLVNIFNLIFAPPSSSPSETTTTTTTTTTTPCGGLIGFGLACP